MNKQGCIHPGSTFPSWEPGECGSRKRRVWESELRQYQPHTSHNRTSHNRTRLIRSFNLWFAFSPLLFGLFLRSALFFFRSPPMLFICAERTAFSKAMLHKVMDRPVTSGWASVGCLPLLRVLGHFFLGVVLKENQKDSHHCVGPRNRCSPCVDGLALGVKAAQVRLLVTLYIFSAEIEG